MTGIVVLGAGYAGLTAAVSLAARTRRRDNVRITVVNASERFTERLRLHQVASGQQLAELRIPDLLAGTVAVCGSGLTGVEAAAEIAEQHPRLQVVLLGRQEPGATMGPKAGAYLRAALERLGVRVCHGVEVTAVTSDGFDWPLGTVSRPTPCRAPAECGYRAGGGREAGCRRARSHRDRRRAALGVATGGSRGRGRESCRLMHGIGQGGMPTGTHTAVSIVRELDGRRP